MPATVAREQTVLVSTGRPGWVSPQVVAAVERHHRIEQVYVWGEARPAFPTKVQLALAEARFLVRMLRRPTNHRRHAAMIAFDGHFALLLLAWCRILDAPLLLMNFYLHDMQNNRLLRCVLKRLLTDHVCVASQSRADAEYFAHLLPSSNISSIAFCQDPLPSAPFQHASPYVFAGGWTNRDYIGLLRAAACLPR